MAREMTRFVGTQGKARSASLLLVAHGVVVCSVVATTACLAPTPECVAAHALTVAVEPRVVMDGAVELGQRAVDSIIVDEVIFHAPSVLQRDTTAGARDVLGTDPDNTAPLLFRYDIASNDGFGDVLGGARTWVIQEGGNDGDAALEFGFAPFALDGSARAQLEDATGVSLVDLVGHTAYVHGYVLMSAQADGYGTECDGDPDGNPADCKRADGDPDGNPAGPTPESDGDPDGNPADPKPASDGDPDGNPATPRSSESDDADTGEADDASPADGDPDGNPAKPAGRRGFGQDVAVDGSQRGGEHLTTTPVPFLVLLNAPFAMSVPVAQLLDADVSGGEVLPIDLHVSLSELFSTERVGALKDVAATQPQGAVVIEVTTTTAIKIGVRAAGVRRASESATTGGIRVTGDLR